MNECAAAAARASGQGKKPSDEGEALQRTCHAAGRAKALCRNDRSVLSQVAVYLCGQPCPRVVPGRDTAGRPADAGAKTRRRDPEGPRRHESRSRAGRVSPVASACVRG